MASKSRKKNRKKNRKTNEATAEPEDINNLMASALAYFNDGYFDQAEKTYRQVLEINPNEHVALHNLGLTYARQGKNDKALEFTKRSIKVSSDSQLHFFNLGVLLVNMGRNAEAADAYARAIELDPNYAEAYVNLGLLKAQSKNPAAAMELYKSAIRIKPDLTEAHFNLAVLYLENNQKDMAIDCLKTTLRLEPGNKTADHFLKLLSGDAQDFSPKEYITGLFDGYAKRFESHLTGSLRYKAPELLRAAVGRVLGEERKSLRILDLGCGTGLCGPLFADLAGELIGVDLSTEMLTLARKKNIYASLIQGDILDGFNGGENTLDIVISTDVFIYVGELHPVFAACARELKDGGLFAFSTESFPGDGIILRQSGRFAHSSEYIEELAGEFGFSISIKDEIIVRTANAKPIAGHIFVLTKGVSTQPVEAKRLDSIGTNITTAYEDAILHHQAGHIDQAESLYQKVLEEEPGHVHALHYLGVIAFQRGNLNDAFKLISEAISQKSNIFNFHTNLGLVLQAQGNLNESAASFRRSLTLNPEGLEALCNLAALMTNQGNLDEAVTLLKKALELEPNFAQAHSNLANILTGQGKLTEAEDHYRKTVDAAPENPEPYKGYINLLVKLDKHEAAAGYCRKLLVLEPGNSEIERILKMCQEA